MEEKEFIEKLRNGDESAFYELVEKYQLMIFNTCLGFLHDKYAADDIAQEVFIEVYNSIDKFKGDSKLSTWMYRIAVNKSLNQIRSNKKHRILKHIDNFFSSEDKDLEIESSDKNPEDSLKNEELGEELKAAINSLSNNQRIAFTLHNIDDLSYKKIAEIMDLSLSAVESLIHRARKKLIKKLG